MRTIFRFLAVFLASLFVLSPFITLAAEDDRQPSQEEIKTITSQSKETVEDLLMFWEEKDIFVLSATRNEKPISQVAENMTVVTAKDIEEMNAHTVAEVLDRVTGIFVDFQGHDFGGTSILHIQGSEDRHVLVLLDGIAWNFLSGGNAETNSIPVKIIKRIEIVKGPASSAWGSSLGGVINIITKDAGDTPRPSGTLSGSYGEAESRDYSGEVFGEIGPVGYYLFAGSRDSDGLRDERFFRDNDFYAKLSIPLSDAVKIGVTAGHSEPRQKFADFESIDFTSQGGIRTSFATGNVEATLSKEFAFKASLYTFSQKFVQDNDILGLGILGPEGALFQSNTFDEKTTGGNARIIWTHGIHAAVLGVDASHGSEEETIEAGELLQSFGAPALIVVTPEIDKWAVFANDTITIDNFSVTPGLRYDHNSVTGSFTSPSLGITYRVGGHTILRADIARGFTIPPLNFTSGGALFLDPNPSLKPEKVWSYQAGIESSATQYIWVKATIFYHDLSDALVTVSTGAPQTGIFINDGNVRRKGIEVEAESAPLYNFSVKAGVAYVDIKPSEVDEGTVNYAYNVAVKYDDRKSFSALLIGHYIWWDLPAEAMAKYNGFLWDLNLNKRIFSTEKAKTELFFAAHNIFNASQYTLGDEKNPQRWVEAGLRLRF